MVKYIMPKITVVDFMRNVEKEFEVEKGTKLLKALIDNGVDIVHACGGKAKCTTCRVNIDEGTPTKETQKQKEFFKKLADRGQSIFTSDRIFLSCQLLVEHDMMVSPSERFNSVIHDSIGKDTADEITPEPVWVELVRE
ncbi:MAG: (2Fe-2S)-binding protein [Candidatus Thorarchaeota archaeon]|nr:(2Fe-2S)-binding protein [Candidatus Thorarchaeota archaeon]